MDSLRNTQSYQAVPLNEHSHSGSYYNSTDSGDNPDDHSMPTNKEASAAASHATSDHLTTLKLLAIIALAANYVGSNINSYFVGTAEVYFGAALGFTNTQNTWVLEASSLTFACTAPCVGYLQDIFGRKVVLILGCLAGMLGNGLMAGANGFVTSLVGSIFAGLANSLGELTAIAAISELVPVNKRGLFLAINTILLLPLTPGVLYTEMLVTHSTWRWCFWICFAWNGMSLLVLLPTYCRLNIVRPDRERKIATIKSIDYLGMALLIVGCALFLVALTAGGQSHPWTSAYVLVQFFLGLALISVLLVWEWKGASNPVIPFRLFSGQRVVGITFLIAFMVGINYYVILTIGPKVLINVFYPGPIVTGLYGLAPTLALMFGATIGNVLLTVFRGRARELTFAFALIMTAFIGAQAVISPSSPAKTVVFSSLAGFGVGGLLVPTSTIVTFACPQDLIATAVALVAVMRTIGGSVGYAILQNLLYSKIASEVPPLISTNALKAGLPESKVRQFVQTFLETAQEDPLALAKLPVSPQILKAASAGYTQGYANAAKYVFYANVAFGAVAIIACSLLPNIRKFLTNNVVAKTSR